MGLRPWCRTDISNKQNTTQNLHENITNEQEIHQNELEDNEMIQLQDNNCKEQGEEHKLTLDFS